MATSKGGICADCGRKMIHGLSYSIDNRPYCYDCYQKRVAEIKKDEDVRREAYTQIATLAGISDLSPAVVSLFDKMIKDGESLDDIKYVAYYCYSVLELKTDPSVIGWTVRDHYKEAINYRQKQQEVINKNLMIDPKVPARTVKINPKKMHGEVQRKKEKTKIEDL